MRFFFAHYFDEITIETINYLAGYREYLMSFSKKRYKDVCHEYSFKVKKIEMMLIK